MLVICEVCDNNVIDELSARRGETVCVLCKEEAKRKLREEKKSKKTCRYCGFEGPVVNFKKDTRICKKCAAEKMREYRKTHPEKERNTCEVSAKNHAYYLANKKKCLERTKKNRAKKVKLEEKKE